MEVVLKKKEKHTVVKMSEMEPLQIGKIISGESYKGNIVMRTASVDTFEVMNLTIFRTNRCWTSRERINTIEVELLPPTTSVKLVIEE